MEREKKIRRIISIVILSILLVAGAVFGFKMYKKYNKPTIEKSIAQIKKNKITSIENLSYSITDNKVSINGLSEDAKEDGITTVNIPDTIEGYPVTSIASEAFKDNATIETVIIGSNVNDIGMSAFEGCGKIKTIYVGKGTTAIQSKAFKGCINLTTVSFNSSLEMIGLEAFKDTAIKSVYIPESVLSIADAFPADTTIMCKKGSAIASWAKSENIKYQETD